MPALLKGDVVLFAPDSILDGHLPIIFGVVFGLDFRPFLRPRWRDDLPVYRCFLDLGCWPGRVFDPLLVPLLDRVSRHLEIQLCFLPYKNCLDVCLHIRNKSAHPVRVRFLGK
jgi:hypothetical protein